MFNTKIRLIIFQLKMEKLYTINKNKTGSWLYLRSWLLIAKFRLKLEKVEKTTRLFSSVAQSCPTLCDPMNRSKPGLPVHHQLPEFPKFMCIKLVMPSSHLILCHPLLLLPPIPPIRVFSNESTLHIRWKKYWSFSFNISPSNGHPGLISFRIDWLVGSPCSPRDSQESFPTPQFKSINSSALSFLHSPTLTPIGDHWKNHSLE